MSNWLFEKMMEPCHMVDKTTIDGPFGPQFTWKDGAALRAAIVKENSLAARVAEHDGVKSLYTITAPESVTLDFNDVIRRDSDGATFRVTTNSADSKPPKTASFSFTQVKAERWDIPE